MLSRIINNARRENNMITIRNQSVNLDREAFRAYVKNEWLSFRT